MYLTEVAFQNWIYSLIEMRTELTIDMDQLVNSVEYRYNLVFILQMVSSEFEFQLAVLHADHFCECSGKRHCFYCLIYEVTQSMTVAAYLKLELIDMDEFDQLR